MPIEYVIEDGVVLTRAVGRFDDQGLLDHVRRLMADPRHTARVPEVFDARGVTELLLTGEGQRRAAELMRHASDAPPSRLAILVASDAAFGLARMYQMLRDDIDVRIFDEYDLALAWARGDPAVQKG